MVQMRHRSIHVAPLHISRDAAPATPGLNAHSSSSHRDPRSHRSQDARATRSLTLHEAYENLAVEPTAKPTHFHHYLRGLHAFVPDGAQNSLSVNLPFDENDIMLIHSVLANGWADGTLLTNGQRGWVPTNFCTPYEREEIKKLMTALTDLWDLVHAPKFDHSKPFNTQDVMQSFIAAVRYLLVCCRSRSFERREDNDVLTVI